MRKALLPFLLLSISSLPSFAQKPELFIPRLDLQEEYVGEAKYSPDGQFLVQLFGTVPGIGSSGHAELWVWRTTPLRPIRRLAAPEELKSDLLETPDFSGRYWFSADSQTLFAECAGGILKVLIDEGQQVSIPSRIGQMFSRLDEAYLSEDGRFYLKIGNKGGWIENEYYPDGYNLELLDLAGNYPALALQYPDEAHEMPQDISKWLYDPGNLGVSEENDALFFHFPFGLDAYFPRREKLAKFKPGMVTSLPLHLFEKTKRPRKLSGRFDIWRKPPTGGEGPYDLSITQQPLDELTSDEAASVHFELAQKEKGAAHQHFKCYCQEIGSLTSFEQGKKLLFSLRPCGDYAYDTIVPQQKIMMLDLEQSRLKMVMDSMFFAYKIKADSENIYFSTYDKLAKAPTSMLAGAAPPLSLKNLEPPGQEENDDPALRPAHKQWPSFFSLDAPDSSFQLGFFYNYTSQVVLTSAQSRGWTKMHKGTVSLEQACISPDNRFVFLAVDGRIDIWDTRNHTLVAELIFLDVDGWVAIAPSGLFDASPHAMNKLFFVVGRETVELEQLKERYYEPGLLPKLLGLSDEPIRSVSRLESVPLYPVVEAEIRKDSLYIQLKARSGGIGKVSLFINDKEILEEANPERRPSGSRDSSLRISLEDYARYFYAHPDSANRIMIRAYNEAGWLRSSPLELGYKASTRRARGEGDSSGFATSFDAVNDPALYAIIIGTADYAGQQLDLKYSGQDAIAMATAIQQAGSQLFGVDEVFIQLLTTDTAEIAMHPKKDNIQAAFRAFEQQAKAEDILLVYLSGHGITYGDADRAQFYYLTQEIASIDLSDDGIRQSRAISSSELTRWINLIPAQKQVLILDACYSGGLIESLSSSKKSLSSTQVRAFDRMQDRTGMFVLAGSASNKVSYEAGKYGQGLLTYSLLQGIDGLALREGKYVDVARLFEFAQQRVPELAEGIGGIQQPMADGPLRGSFDIGINNEAVNISLSSPKPVFVRNYFQDEVLFDDVLGLGKLLEEHFLQMSSKGVGAQLIYVDIPEYAKAYSLKGRYQRREGEIRVYGKLFKGREAIRDFDVSLSRDALSNLPSAILMQLEGAIE